MKQDWHPDELAQYWTLSTDECELLGNMTGVTRLSFAILLKSFQFDGRFPEHREEIASSIVAHLANQTKVSPQEYFDDEWSERTHRHQRARIREHCGFRLFRTEDETALVKWLSERVTSPTPESESLKIIANDYLRSQRFERPATKRMRRLLGMAVAQREERIITETATQLSQATCEALDTLVKTQAEECSADADQMLLFPVRSELATVKEGAASVKVATVLDEIAKLKQLRARIAGVDVPRCARQVRYPLPATRWE